PDGATLTIRKFPKTKLTGDDYLKYGSINKKMLKFLELCVAGKCSIIVSGGTGSGKTTLLNMLSNYIPPREAIVTVEDSCELNLYQDNVRRLEARPTNMEGKGEITIRRLVKNTLRMRPDRIIVGEIRDGCIVDMLRAMLSGHAGGITTVHANSPKDLVEATLLILFGMSDMNFTEMAQKQQICSSIDLIVQISRLQDGSRKITNITHVVGLGNVGATNLKLKNVDENKIYIQDVYRFKQTGIDDNNKVVGKFETTGYQPKKIIDKIEKAGMDIPSDLFEKDEV
ncbi:MAG: ATPase, T2SS/T4P/T4SS family, partial [Candidatus Methanomethylophilus sp.]|nr:ATPase, T2SS/T4P/T4SS family [Methanomethylophilus sp.]